ncbi:hypothetical protein OROMI_007754 [Orobanche minor]
MQMFYATWNNANEGRLVYGDDSIQALVAHIGYIHQFGFGSFVPFQHNQGLILAMHEGAMMHGHPWRYQLYSPVTFHLDLWLEMGRNWGGGIGPQQLNMIAIYNFLIGQQLTHIIAAIAADAAGNAAAGNAAADVGAAGVGGEAAAGGGEGGEAAGVGGEAVVEEIDDDAPEKSKSTTESSKSKSTTDAEDEAGPSKKRRLLPSKEIP